MESVMPTDLFPKTRRLISGSACRRELSDFADWLLSEGYTAAPIHIHLIYLDQALARLARPHDPTPRALAEVERAFDPGGGPPTRRTLFQGTRRAYVRFMRARGRLIEPPAEDRFANLRREYEQYITDLRGLSTSARHHHSHTVTDFLVRGVASRNLSALTQSDVEAFVVLRGREVSRHSMQHEVGQVRSFGLPFKHGAQEAPIEYLERAEIEALLNSIDRTSARGRRDYALFALMFNTAARVQEALDLRRRDVRLDAPCQVRLHGKGSKVRLYPIWPATARLLRDLREEIRPVDADPADAFLFTNVHGRQMTRFGVRYLLRKYVAAASRSVTTRREKRIHPHSVRHSTAVALLKAGVDFATISQWLGHASLNTTMRYARADLDLKRQALSQVFPDALAPPRGGHLLLDGGDLLGWLRRM
jgi:site-specific recombinase XerD